MINYTCDMCKKKLDTLYGEYELKGKVKVPSDTTGWYYFDYCKLHLCKDCFNLLSKFLEKSLKNMSSNGTVSRISGNCMDYDDIEQEIKKYML